MYRRDCLKTLRDAAIVGGLSSLGGVPPVKAQTKDAATDPQPVPTDTERAAMAKFAHDFMTKYQVPGLSIAIARHGQMVYQQGFGVANKETHEAVTPKHRFRIASVTKPITSVTLFTLIEQGKLHIDDRVFGPGSILGHDFGSDYKKPDWVNQITVHDLMTHTCGGWTNDANDPMFLEINLKMNHAELITWTLHNQSLVHKPGTHYAYSNFGYCILGRVIEKLTGEPYDVYVKRTILERCGVHDMQIAGNTEAEIAPNEVHYYYPDPNPDTITPYTMNVRRMDSHGGWIATPTDLVNFACHVDGLSSTRDILRPATLVTMTTPTAASKSDSYACGWAVNSVPNWWHNGSLSGTSTIMVRTASGLCWAAFTNFWAPPVDDALDGLVWNMAGAVPAWHA